MFSFYIVIRIFKSVTVFSNVLEIFIATVLIETIWGFALFSILEFSYENKKTLCSLKLCRWI